MKNLAATLSFYILFLAILPSMANVSKSLMKNHCQKTCCPDSKSCENKSDGNKNNGCKKNSCTPFFSCPKMQVLVPATTFLNCKQIKFNHQYVLSFESNYSTSLASVWHPPKVA